MNIITQEAVAYAPCNLNKIQIAKWIKAKWNTLSWEEAHYHAMHTVMVRVEGRIREMFMSIIGEEPDEEALRDLFDRSLSEKYDYVCDWLDLPRCNQTMQELILTNIDHED